MQREIKFRAWCTYDNTMQEVSRLDFESEYVEYMSGEHDRITTPILLQYTGLKDATPWEKLSDREQQLWLATHKKEEWNGKEIYEGDIVTDVEKQCIGCGYVSHLTGVIEWDEEMLTYMLRNKDGESALSYYNELEVVGNVYENPELLKGAKE